MKGIYAYLGIHDNSLKYIGSAVGKNGLRGRIWSQHLNPIYLESRKNKFTEKDKKQLSKRVLRNNKPVIEKSAFRKNLARKYDLTPGESCLKFLKENFLLVFAPLIDYDTKEILSIEKHLILNENPEFNRRKF
ncbi:MAG TPA: hypothetical protein ENK91_13595 [Bacteroidetes bacterium]|nr:hypothetical protein [Bacteroidota bacterium]